jgi:hypothetical protein
MEREREREKERRERGEKGSPRFSDQSLSKCGQAEEASESKYQLLLPSAMKVVWKFVVVDYILGRGSQHGGYIASPVMFGWYEFGNIFFMGIVGALVASSRILYSIGVSLLVLPRTDMSVLPRGFEDYDPVYGSFQAMIQMDAEHNNPVATVFMYLMIGSAEEHRHHLNTISVGMRSVASQKRFQQRRVRNRWLLLLTLVNNPSLVGERVHKKKVAPSPAIFKRQVRQSIYSYQKPEQKPKPMLNRGFTAFLSKAKIKKECQRTKIITLKGVPKGVSMHNTAVRGRMEQGGRTWSWFVTSDSFAKYGLIPERAYRKLFHEEVVGQSQFDLHPQTFVDRDLRKSLFDGNWLPERKRKKPEIKGSLSTGKTHGPKLQLRTGRDTRTTVLCPQGKHFLKSLAVVGIAKPSMSFRVASECCELMDALEHIEDIADMIKSKGTSPSEALKNSLCDHLKNMAVGRGRVHFTSNVKMQCSVFIVPSAARNACTICFHCESLVKPYAEKCHMKLFASYPIDILGSGVHVAFLEQFWALEREVVLFVENALTFNPYMQFTVSGYQNVSSVFCFASRFIICSKRGKSSGQEERGNKMKGGRQGEDKWMTNLMCRRY